MEKNLKFIFWIVNIIYTVFILSLFFLDYFLFVDFFGFEKGLFFSLFDKVDFVSISSIVLLILLSFLFIGLYVYISIFVYNEFSSKKTVKASSFYPSISLKKKKNLIFSDLKKIHLHLLKIKFWLFLIFLPILYVEVAGLFSSNSFLVLYVSILIYISISLFMTLKIENDIYKNVFSFNTIVLYVIIGLISILIFFKSDIYLKSFILFYFSSFISYMIMLLYSDIKNGTEKISNGAILLFFAFYILMAYSIFMHFNKSSWSKEINSNNIFSTNLIFNNGNLQTNSLDIQIKIPNKYYSSLVNQIKYYERKNINQLCIDGNLLDEYMYTISDKYFYLEIASNLKMYFKNLFIENENAEKKFIGYRIFIIEEKKYANREGSEYILVNAKNKIINDISYKIMLKKLEDIDKKYLKINKDGIKMIDEDYVKGLVSKDKKKFHELLNKYYLKLI